MPHFQTVTAFISAILALLAAALWFVSARVKVKAGGRPNNPDGFQTTYIYIGSGDNEYELVETLVRQSKWSRLAAIAACLSAIFQSITIYEF